MVEQPEKPLASQSAQPQFLRVEEEVAEAVRCKEPKDHVQV
jgi:hypothetical protein